MDLALRLLAALTAAILAAVSVDVVRGSRRLVSLSRIPPGAGGPSVSIIAAARNEARGIEAAIASLLVLDYSPIEIIVVDDRSDDATGAILDRLAAANPVLRVEHVAVLPDGWLGKNHALHVGAAKASGELLLFTDADVVFEPSTLRRAVAFMGREGLDHLAAIPDVRVPGVALSAFVAAFGVFFSLYSRPWKVSDPRSRAHIGIGAFNLIRTAVYRAIGGHQTIAMRPDDDLKLGKVVKKAGFRQGVVSGAGFVVVEWYTSLGELVDGLMKNAFAGLEYSMAAVVGGTVAMLVLDVWPFVALVVTHGLTWALNVSSVLCIAIIFWMNARFNRVRFAYVVAFPLAALLFIYIIWRSALLALVRGQIRWRGTDYPLARMRANRV